jgi:hypothetical protein
MAEIDSVFILQSPAILQQSPIPGTQSTPFEQSSSTQAPLFQLTNTLIRIESKIESLEKQVQRPSTSFARINVLQTKNLRSPIEVVIETDEAGFTARALELPLYGTGDDPKEAIEMLKREIESLYEDLKTDDNFTEDWLKLKKYLCSAVIDEK